MGRERLTEPFRILLGNRSLTWLLAAFAALTIAEWGYVTALAVDAFRQDGALVVGLVGFRLFFAALSSIFSVSYTERRAGGAVLTIVAGLRATIVATSSVLAAAHAPLASLLGLVAIDGIVSAPYRPAQSAMLPVLARSPRELAASAAAISTVKTLSQAIGAMGGASLLVVTTPLVAFAVSAGLFLAASLIAVRFSRMPIALDSSVSPERIGERIRGMLEMVREPHVGGLLVASGLRTFVRGMWLALAVIAALRLLHGGSAAVGLLMLAAGIGSLAAVPLSAMLIGRARLGTPTAIALIACGIPFAFVAGVPVLDIALAFIVAWGIGMAVADVATSSLLYRLIDIPLVPRATALIESAKLGLEGLGALLAPVLASILGIRWALIVAAFPLPVVVIAGWKMLHRLDAMAGERAQTLALLHAVPCLQTLDLVALESLAGGVTQVHAVKGDEIVRQGDQGDRLFVVKAGAADILVDGYYVGSVGAGGSFGERALLRNTPRTATVRACEPMELLALSREDFLTALSGHAEHHTVIRERPVEPATEWTSRERARLLARLSLFSHLDTASIRKLGETSRIDHWPEGARIVRQGDEGDRFFVVLDGRAQVAVDHHRVGELHQGDQFGEIALLHGVPRTADVTAATPVMTLSLDRDDFATAVRSRVILG